MNKQRKWVYFVRCARYIKIGYSNDPFYRIESLKCMSPFPMAVIGVMAGTEATERKLHRRFRAHKHRGEWFRENPALSDYIRARATAELFRRMHEKEQTRLARNAEICSYLNRRDIAARLP